MLFFCSTVVGQSDTLPHTHNTLEWIPLNYGDESDGMRLMTYESLLLDWDEHKAECYADSAEVGYEYTWGSTYYEDGSVAVCHQTKRYCICTLQDERCGIKARFDCRTCLFPEDFKSEMGVDYDTCKPIIWRRDPNNLSEFMEFLKRKYMKP